MPIRFAHTNIIATDWQALAEFYVSVFDCDVKPPVRKFSGDWLSQGTGVPSAELQGVHLTLPGYGKAGPTLEIYSYTNTIKRIPHEANTQGLAHLAFEVDDVMTTCERIVEQGGALAGEISDCHIAGVGNLTFVYARDPEGNLIELQTWKQTASSDN